MHQEMGEKFDNGNGNGNGNGMDESALRYKV